ncbi:transglycosylase SLT domain-containing protein [Vibrio salinus]|uniref:transglycosylase SLT domain-containing protein n=1 Tax=Vibrio salinus TaxID=2899784 RepID=UPI001E5C7549|nr:transglycosylase SLT domain-containing protein [Vibrio salinus]MCE0493218.1 transglycosylase SLT domain-containing protein [Vibrio salinus]
MIFLSNRIVVLAAVAFLISLNSMSVKGAPLTLKEQRSLYDQSQKWLDNRQVSKYYKIESKLADYPLRPYLDYRAILIDLDKKSPIVVRNFIDSHREFPFSARISAPYLRALAKGKKWSLINVFQKSEPRGEEFQCYYYTALYHTGQKKAAFRGAQKLWLQGHSVSKQCDGLFVHWEQEHKISDDLIIERMLLSFENRQYSLLKYLSGKVVTLQKRQLAQKILKAYRSPQNIVGVFGKGKQDRFYRKLIELSLNRLAFKNVESAYALLNDLSHSLDLSQSANRTFLKTLQNNVAGQLLYKADTTSLNHLNGWRDSVIAKSGDDQLIERRIRYAIKKGNWQDINDWINRLSRKEVYSSRWQFWKAQSEIHLGDNVSGKERLRQLTDERSFYSAAAATVLHKLPRYSIDSHVEKRVELGHFKRSLARIRELVLRDKASAAKSEWYWLLSRANLSEKRALAYFARDSHWYHFSIIASIKASMWDNLSLRFPVAYKDDFERYGNKYNVDPVTLMSVARQESAMDKSARSPVGARGLMQVMPNTAKYAARKYRLDYRRRSDLYDPEKNIEIGTRYLDELLKKYDGNRILAFAAYNAGPRRVDNWLNKSSGSLDVYRFIESIPFKETRGYVQNILMFETYYRSLLNTNREFLSPSELKAKY